MTENETTEIEIDPHLWLSKTEAADYAGVSIRSLERREAAGQLEKRILPRGGGVVYSKADLKAIKHGNPRPVILPGPGAPDPYANGAAAGVAIARAAAPRVEPLALIGAVELLADTIEKRGKAAPVKPWLTLEEAAEYSGLPIGWLRKQAIAGVPFVINVGTEKARRFRFCRVELERLGQ